MDISIICGAFLLGCAWTFFSLVYPEFKRNDRLLKNWEDEIDNSRRWRTLAEFRGPRDPYDMDFDFQCSRFKEMLDLIHENPSTSESHKEDIKRLLYALDPESQEIPKILGFEVKPIQIFYYNDLVYRGWDWLEMKEALVLHSLFLKHALQPRPVYTLTCVNQDELKPAQ